MLKLVDIVKNYDVADMKVEALKGINIDFRKNEFVSILGPSGCGKTTLLNIIGGLDKYTSGDLIINGVSTKEYRDGDWDTYRNHSIGFVFQSYNLIPHQTVLRNVELALTLSGVSKEERKKRAVEALEKVGLADQLNKRPNQMSGGQMQRVAIARAIVNNPDIILADEPTGALDSETSIQVMEILKELSKDILVIMVTHNPEIANRYSTRIIKLLDGKMISDNNPYESKEAAYKEEDPSKKRKTAMSIFTAFSLSLNNLFTKKGRTLLTAIAGSIGIIGIALVLSLSNGFQSYIDKVQADTLSSYPLTISQTSMDYESVMNYRPQTLNKFPSVDKLFVNQLTKMLTSIMSNNDINENYLENVIEQIPADLIYGYSYGYGFDFPIYKNVTTQTAAGTYEFAFNVNSTDMTSSFFGGGLWAQLMSNKEFVLSQYDVIYGNYPEQADEVILVVDQYNQLSDVLVSVLGIDTTIIEEDENGVQSIDFEKLIGYEYKMIMNDILYKPVTNGDGVITHYEQNTSISDYVSIDAYNNPENKTIKISGIMRLNEASQVGSMGQVSVIGYTEALTEYVFQENYDSEIVKWQRNNPTIDVFTGLAFDISTGQTAEEQCKNNLEKLGGSKIPTSISIYPVDFNAKEDVKEYLTTKNVELNENATNKFYYEIGLVRADEFNRHPDSSLTEEAKYNYYVQLGKDLSTEAEREEAELIGTAAEVKYTDIMAIMVSAINTVINAISYVLIAFTAISLVVSSIMIGIITYISVIERTKEIGILRSVGARKKDISRVFNAETFLIGLGAGIFGVLVTVLLSIPINMILSSLVQINNIASLNPVHAIVIIIISFCLTLISGLIPSRIAAKKDPVTALRTE